MDGRRPHAPLVADEARFHQPVQYIVALGPNCQRIGWVKGVDVGRPGQPGIEQLAPCAVGRQVDAPLPRLGLAPQRFGWGGPLFGSVDDLPGDRDRSSDSRRLAQADVGQLIRRAKEGRSAQARGREELNAPAR